MSMPFPTIDAKWKPAESKKWFFKLIHLRGHNYSGWNTRGRYMKYLSLLILLIISFILFMPFKRPKLSDSTIAVFKQWRDSGTPQ